MATQTEITNFIKRLGRLAVNECNNRISAGKGFVLPSVCIAQSAIETGWGTAGIMVKANAFFGIKAGGSWTGAVYRADTWEVDSGGAYNTTANFRAYGSLTESVTDYYNLIGNNSRYANGLSHGSDKSKWLTPKQCITAIWSGGYATDTLYVEKIMSTINSRNLTAYDDLVTGEGVLPDGVVTFTISDMVQGKLVGADSGRSVTNDTSSTTNIALDWNKAYTPITDSKFIVNFGTSALRIHFVELNDTGYTEYTPLINGGQFNAKAGQKFGFYFSWRNLYTTDNLLVDMEGLKDLKVTFDPGFDTPNGEETTVNGIAYFVKIT